MLERGLSAIVGAIILILIAIMAIGVFWFGIKPIIGSLGDSSSGNATNVGISRSASCINANLQIISCVTNSTSNITSVRVLRGLPEGPLDGVRLVFTTPNGIEAFTSNLVPESFGSEDYRIDDNDEIARAFSVDIAAVVGDSACSLIGVPIVCVDGAPNENATIVNAGTCSNNNDEDSDGLIDWPFDPGCSSAEDANEAGGPGKEEIYALMWTTTVSINRPFTSKIYSSYSSARPVDDLVAEAKDFTDSQPEGHKGMIIFNLASDWLKLSGNESDRYPLGNTLYGNVNFVWWDNGVNKSRFIVDDFLNRYKLAGGELDVLVLDIEVGFDNFFIGSDSANLLQQDRWATIQDDFSFSEISDDLGFTDLTTVHNWRSGNNYRIWGWVNEKRRRDYIDSAFYQPLQSHFGNAKLLNYGSANDYDSAISGSGDIPFDNVNGHGTAFINAPGLNAQDNLHVGDRQSPNLYGWMGQITLSGRGPDGITYPDSAFNSFRYSVNQMRAPALNDDALVTPWLARRSYDGDRNNQCALTGLPVALGNSDYWQESVLHASLGGVDDFVFWAPSSNCDAGVIITAQQDVLRMESDQEILSDSLAEFNLVTGFSGKRSLLSNDGDGNFYGSGLPFKELAPWTFDYVLTGMTSGGRKVWRFTPVPPGAGVIPFDVPLQVENDLRIFRQSFSSTTIITFTNAKIWQPQNPVSNKGYWIVQSSSGLVNITTCSALGCSAVIG